MIDNFSRRILSWKLVLRLEPQTTCQILVEAAKNLPKNGDGATVIADSGIENVNGEVDSARAREARMKSNRELSCEACRLPVQDTPETSDSSAEPPWAETRQSTDLSIGIMDVWLPGGRPGPRASQPSAKC